jgi:thiol-disulfide isomerase/thioredoxin
MKRGIIVFLSISLFTFVSLAQNKLPFDASELVQLKKLKAKVEANPSDLKAHEEFINVFRNNRNDDPVLEEQYNSWIAKFPQNYIIPYAIGKSYLHHESPKSEHYLLQASKLKPSNAEIWSLLAINASFEFNQSAEQEYLKKATQIDPTNPDYALSYAYFFRNIDPLRYDSLSIEFIRKFPDSEKSIQTLYLLAENASLQAEKIAYYKQLYNQKSNQLSDWYLSGMTSYFDLLLKINPEQAFELGLSMVLEGKRNRNVWKDRIKVADIFITAKELMAQNNPQQALIILNQVDLGNVNLGSYKINAEEALLVFKAEAADAANKTKMAYDSVAIAYSKTPTENLHQVLYKYGYKLKMDSAQIITGIQKMRNSEAKKATNLLLTNYYTANKISLTDFAGKVTLLTYWFPGCAPCRQEFPHFESVLKKFDNKKVSYIGINIYSSQDGFVLPFLKASGYSFIPLSDPNNQDKGNLSFDAAPTNYLIDQKGRIVFSHFRIDKENEKTLELMIKETLAAKD